MSTLTIAMIQDDTLDSGPDGESMTYWSTPGLYNALAGSRAVRMQMEIVSISTNTVVAVVGQWSLDGRNWTNFGAAVSAPNIMTSTGSYDSYYSGGAAGKEFSAYVRFGIAVAASSGTDLVSARATTTLFVEGVNSGELTNRPTYLRSSGVTAQPRR